MSRYENRTEIVNDLERYKNLFKSRGVNFIRMYKTPVFKHLTIEEIKEVTTITHQWSSRDTFYKLAHHHYGDPTLWWIIAWYNQMPTDSHPTLGQTIYVPTPLQKILALYGV
tara:strand:- start:241 stop:576 length:336 start_codon:yes stop_codon:yes gene_type:complete